MYCLGLILVAVTLTQAKDQERCFQLAGGSVLEFQPEGLDISNRVHYTMQFQTTEPTGILMYSEGPDDYEALFLNGGKLFYLLVNPTPSGVESSVGGLFVSDGPVNTGSWVTVDLWRNWQPDDESAVKTGMRILNMTDNTEETHVDHIFRNGVQLDPQLFIGGFTSSQRHTRGSAPQYFNGKIRRIHEDENNMAFEDYSLNHGQQVKPCETDV